MFMPGPPEITPEQQAAMRRDVAKGVLSFVSVVATIRVTMGNSSSEIKIKIFVKLDPPLPKRQFITVCKQRTVRELRNELKRRIITISNKPITLTLDGYELMDDDEVADVILPTSEIHLKLSESIAASANAESESPESSSAESPKRPHKVISRKEHGDDRIKGKNSKTYLAEEVYESAQPQEQSSADVSSEEES
ncbi:hypothetical protein EV183_003974 [Coemansia sp. RSA 2336]|nr:hypothetical protein EV183_003974 [Coemansia sp. RSA 2336]